MFARAFHTVRTWATFAVLALLLGPFAASTAAAALSIFTLRLDANHAGNADPPNSDFSTLYKGTPVTGVGAVGSSRGELRIGGGSSAQGERAGWNGLVDNLAIWQGVPSDLTLLNNANTHH